MNTSPPVSLEAFMPAAILTARTIPAENVARCASNAWTVTVPETDATHRVQIIALPPHIPGAAWDGRMTCTCKDDDTESAHCFHAAAVVMAILDPADTE